MPWQVQSYRVELAVKVSAHNKVHPWPMVATPQHIREFLLSSAFSLHELALEVPTICACFAGALALMSYPDD